jgi:hypothetical protein
LAVYYLASRFELAHTPLLVACGIVVGWPVKVSLGARYERWRRMRRARALGAVPASELRGKLLGDIDIVWEVEEINKNGFVGEFLTATPPMCKSASRSSKLNSVRLEGEWFAAKYEDVGSGTMAGAFFGEYFLMTSDPGNIKMILATEFKNFEKGSSSLIQ